MWTSRYRRRFHSVCEASKRTFEFRAETFNLFNTPQFSDPGLAVDSPTFGVINTTSVNPRILQLALKISF